MRFRTVNEIITLQQLLDMLNALPESIRNKRIGYMDLAHLEKIQKTVGLKQRRTKMDEQVPENAGHAENPDTGEDSIWYTEDFCVNVFYEDGL